MAKKSNRVPDFSTKKPQVKFGSIAQSALKQTHPAQPHPAQPQVKPHSTSQKSGRRGS